MSISVKIGRNTIEIPDNSDLRNVLNINFPCGGHGKCGKCKIKVKSPLLPYSETELELLTEEEIENNIHLACITKPQNGMEIVLLTECGDAQDKIINDGSMPEFTLKPTYSKFGAAIDIGTTTIAARLYDAKGNIAASKTMLNPQSAWGADVISRVEAAIAGEAKEITGAVLHSADQLITGLTESAGLSASYIDGTVITGNTVMLSLLTAESAEPFSKAPFICKRLFGETIKAKQLGLNSLSPDTDVYLPHCISAFIGADIVTALLASDICSDSRTKLLVDIGTNGEMALWHRGKLYFCSTAAGPAFEGVGISMGMSCRNGAIDRIDIVDGKLSVHTVGDIAPCGICGSGIIDVIAGLLKMEIIDETGYMENPAEISSSVCIEPKDVRAVQLSKSAICSGILTLLENAGITCEDVEKVYIAGGFGSYINIENACFIGLLPMELKNKVQTIGNAALSGAAMILLNKDFRSEIVRLIETASLIELSGSKFFADSYIENITF